MIADEEEVHVIIYILTSALGTKHLYNRICQHLFMFVHENIARAVFDILYTRIQIMGK